MPMCTLAEVVSPRKNILERKIFQKKAEAQNFKAMIEGDSDKKVRFKKVQC